MGRSIGFLEVPPSDSGPAEALAPTAEVALLRTSVAHGFDQVAAQVGHGLAQVVDQVNAALVRLTTDANTVLQEERAETDNNLRDLSREVGRSVSAALAKMASNYNAALQARDEHIERLWTRVVALEKAVANAPAGGVQELRIVGTVDTRVIETPATETEVMTRDKRGQIKKTRTKSAA